MLCALVCTKKEKYVRRLHDFIEHYGIICKEAKSRLLVTLLAEDEPRPDFIEKDIQWVNFPQDPMSLRFTNYMANYPVSCDWIMQVDDDSSTDIDKTLEILDQYYDYKDPVVLMAGRNTDLELGLQDIARSFNTPNFFFGHQDITKFKGQPLFTHSWGSTIISSAGVKKIKNWAGIKKYIDMCRSVKTVFSDQVPYLAAKLAKVPISESTFMSPFSDADQYTALNTNGRYSHIHYVKEEWSNYKPFIEALKSNKKFTSPDAVNSYLSRNRHIYIPPKEELNKIIKNVRMPNKPTNVVLNMSKMKARLNQPSSRYNNVTRRK